MVVADYSDPKLGRRNTIKTLVNLYCVGYGWNRASNPRTVTIPGMGTMTEGDFLNNVDTATLQVADPESSRLVEAIEFFRLVTSEDNPFPITFQRA